jgi:hypothetical protein
MMDFSMSTPKNEGRDRRKTGLKGFQAREAADVRRRAAPCGGELGGKF